MEYSIIYFCIRWSILYTAEQKSKHNDIAV